MLDLLIKCTKIIKFQKVNFFIFQVLDARDPLGSRSKCVEESVLNSGKRLVLLLNKIDLVPKENVKKWLSYLRLQLPTIAFKASTQEQNRNLVISIVSASSFVSFSGVCNDDFKCGPVQTVLLFLVLRSLDFD